MKNNSAFFLMAGMVLLCLTSLGKDKHKNVLTRQQNRPVAGDSIVKQQVTYVNPGISGTNIEWQFSRVKPVNPFYTVLYRSIDEDTTHFISIENGTVYQFEERGDSLFQVGYENRTTKVANVRPELKIKYPLRFGNSFSSSFEEVGEFCHTSRLKAAGTTQTEVDAYGTLYCPLGLTFKDALRVKTVKEYTETGVDSVTMRVENYSWYVPHSRYPVFETFKTLTRKLGGEETEQEVASFFYPPSDQAYLLMDPTNWDMDENEDDELSDIDKLLGSCELMPNPVKYNLYIEFDLLEDADISFLLFDARGVARDIVPNSHRVAGHYRESVTMQGLIPGIYPVHVVVNGMVKVLRIIKQ